MDSGQTLDFRRRKQLSSSSQKGVCFYKPTGKWKAQIVVEGKPVHLGYFYTEEDASAAYRSAVAKELMR
jgi:hypothetical protein